MDKKISKQNQSELLDTLELWFGNAVTADSDWKDTAKVRYNQYHGTQWTSDEIAILQERSQAVSTFNHIAPAIDSVIGSERLNRPKITMAGRTLDDDRIAQVKTSLYDYIQYNSKTDDEIDKMIQDCLVAGRGTMMIDVRPSSLTSAEIFHEFIDYRDIFNDPLSKKDNLLDCRYIHYAKFVDEDIVDRLYRKYNPEEDSTGGINSFESSSEDEMWFENNDRERPRLITTWYRDEKGNVSTAIWVRGKILFKSKKPYELNDFPFVQISYKKRLDNTPYGMVEAMVSAQDEINKRHSKALHYLNSKQVLAEENAFVSWAEAEKTLARPDGITKLIDGALAEGRVQIVPTSQLADTHIKMMELAKANLLSSAGLNGAMVGQSGQYESAKKTNSSISQAQSTLIPFLNKLRITRYGLATKTMRLVPEFYNDEQLIRILQPNGQYAFMPINEVSLLDDGSLQKINDITVDDVDIIIEDAPRGLNEKAEQLNQLLTIQGQTQRPIPMEILIRYTDVKDKHQLADELKSHYDMETQLQQAQQQIEMLQQELQKAGGMMDQKDSQITQVQSARAIDKEVMKAKEKINKEIGIL